MRTNSIVGLALCVIALASSTASADMRVLRGNHKRFKIDCAKQPEVDVVGNHLTVTLKGTCTTLVVTGNHATVKGSAKTVNIPGNHATVALDQTEAISVPGNENKVTWKKSSAESGPTIANPGNQNTISKL